MNTRRKNNKWVIVNKNKTCSLQKTFLKKIEAQAAALEKIFANYIAGQDLNSKIYKELLQTKI